MGSVFGYELDSELPLVRARRERGPRGILTVRHWRGAASLLEREGELVSLLEDPDGRFEAVVARTETGVLTWLADAGTFHVDVAAGSILVEPPLGATARWEHRLLNVAVPMLLAERGDLLLHASAALVDGAALIFCGPSGRGKSTLAHTLASAGFPTLGDDGVAVAATGAADLVVWAGPRGVCIRDDASRNGDKQVVLGAPAERRSPFPPLAIVVLGARERAGLRIEPVNRARALLALTHHITCAGPDRIENALPAAARVVESVPVYRCHMPDDLEQLPTAAIELVEQLTTREREAAA